MAEHIDDALSASRSRYTLLNEDRKEIRLIEIVQGTTSPLLIECKLDVVSLDDKPVFTALSYVWGDPSITKDILLDDRTFPVTVSLANALHHILQIWQQAFPGRDPRTFRLWADAICINQADSEERNSQVQMMGTLYSSAELVNACLGFDDDFVEEALNACKTISKEIAGFNDGDDELVWLERYPSWCKPSENIRESKPWHPMTRLGYVTYWKRVWIFQELVLAHRIVFSHRMTAIEFMDLKRSVDWHQRVQDGLLSGSLKRPTCLDIEIYDMLTDIERTTMTSNMERVIIQRKILELIQNSQEIPRGKDRRILWQAFLMCLDLRATDPRDHIYGLLGITQTLIMPDYARKDLSAVCSDFVSVSLEDTQMLLFMGYAGIGLGEGESDTLLPSWAPNFERIVSLGSNHRIIHRGRSDVELFEGLEDVSEIHHNELRAIAFMGPRIERSHPQTTETAWEDGRGAELLLDLINRKDAFTCHPLTSILHALVIAEIDNDGNFTIETALAFLTCCLIGLSAGDFEDGQPSLDLEARFKQFGFSPIMTEPFLIEFSDIFPVDMGANRTEYIHKFLLCFQGLFRNSFNRMLRFRTEFQRSTRHHCFAEIEDGYLGLVPKCSLVGDIIAIVNGCSVPCVLREQDDHYVHVGTAYVHGLMDGEVMDMLVADQDLMQRMQAIVIR